MWPGAAVTGAHQEAMAWDIMAVTVRSKEQMREGMRGHNLGVSKAGKSVWDSRKRGDWEIDAMIQAVCLRR